MRKLYCLLFPLFMGICCWGQTIQSSGPTTFCKGGSVILTVTGAPIGATYQWTLNGVNILGQTTSTYTAIASGSFNVLVNGTAIIPVDVTVNPNPVVDFSFNNNNSCSGTTIQFISTVSSGTPSYNYFWNFGDGSPVSNSPNPTHAYISLGCGNVTFSAVLTIIDANGCSSSISKIINVKQAPSVDIKDQDAAHQFSNCHKNPTASNPNYTLTILNNSPNSSCISSYNIDWGDGTAVQNNITFPVSHLYTQIGAFNLIISALGSNGCTNSKTYIVANQSNPAGSLGTLGSTTGLCAPSIVPFTITNWQLNSAGTSYILNFGDGTSITLLHPLNANFTTDTIYHNYTTSSCPIPTYTATLQVVNACAITPYTAGNIQIRKKPIASFTSPNSACVNVSLCFTNTTTVGSQGNNCSNYTDYLWDFGDGSPISISQSPCHIFTSIGTYTVTLSTTNDCGTTTFSKQICVVNPPNSSFLVDSSIGCTQVNVATTNTSNTLTNCTPATYLWTVSYISANCGTSSLWNFTNNTTSSSINPSFVFINPGIYTITLSVTNVCGTVTSNKTVTVKKPPTVSINTIPGQCVPASITPVASISNCGTTALTYAWSFMGGNPSSSNTANPGTISYSTPGTYAISLAVTNECGTKLVSQQITVNDVTVSDAGPPQTICGISVTMAGNTPIIGSGLWTKVSGGSATITNTSSPTTTITGLTPGTYVFKWTITNGGCISSSTVTITILAGGTIAAAGPDQDLCLASGATLAGNTPVNGTGIWTMLSGPNTTTIANTSSPNTTISGLIPGIYIFRWTISFSNCSPSTDDVKITIYNSPAISDAGSDQTVCSSSVTLSANTPTVGSGVWTKISGGSATITNTSSPTTTVTNLVAGTYLFKWTITNGNCPSSQDTVQIIVTPAPTAASAGPNQTLCASTSLTLAGNVPSVGTGVWTLVSGPNTPTITNPSSPSTTVTSLIVGTYIFRWTISNGVCPSSSDVVQVTINDNVTIADAGPPQTICGTTVTMAGNTPFIGNGVWSKVSGGTANITSTTSPTTTITNLVPGTYVFKWTITNGGCISSSTVTVTILTGATTAAAGPDQSLCLTTSATLAGNTPTNGIGTWSLVSGPSGTTITTPSSPSTTVTGLTPGIYIFRWTISFSNCSPSTDDVKIDLYDNPTPSTAGPDQIICSSLVTLAGNTPNVGSGVWTQISGGSATITNNISPTTTVTGLVTGTYLFKWTITNGSCPLNHDTVQIIVTATPTIANAGPDQTLCAASSVILTANTPATGTGLWTLVSGPNTPTITSPASPSTTVTTLIIGTYIFRWTITNGVCPNSTDNVQININPNIINIIDTVTQIICLGQSLTINGQLPTGGGGTYSYQWQESIDGITFTNIIGATNQSLTFSPNQSIYLRRFVISSPCSNYSDNVHIFVQSAITNNQIATDSSICINTNAPLLTGSVPSGGNGNYSYQWQLSTNGGVTWNTIAGATGQNYNPGVITLTTKYRRIVATNLCTGPQANSSNIVTIIVRPNAKANFNPSDSLGCAPFFIGNSLLNVQSYPSQNSQYLWYVNNALVSTGLPFGGYTMNNNDDTITLKLKTISLYGCLNDSTSHLFITRKRVTPSFSLSDTVGCGPLIIQIQNTTPIANLYLYQWNFGNGQTSTAVQPGSVTFQQNPNYGDTVYVIKLRIIAPCDTITITKNVLIHSKPKALFTPNITFGCSPFRVLFTNTSKGYNNSYYWDFGDGTNFTTTFTDTFSHIYNTGVRDTFRVKLKVTNSCGKDSLTYAIVVTPNTIRLDFQINGNEIFGCAPHTVHFINNSNGASNFFWKFGDGNTLTTTRNIDTVIHTFIQPGVYNVQLRANNACSDTTASKTITVFTKPIANFIANKYSACIGDTIRFTNQSDSASYLWQFGDGSISTLINPVHAYQQPGIYNVVLKVTRFYSAGNACTDSMVKQVNIVSTMPGSFNMSDTVGSCAPFTINFVNNNIPSVFAVWDFGDGNTGNGDVISHTFATAGTYIVKLNVRVAGGCTFILQRQLIVGGPSGSLLYTGGYFCNQQSARFEASTNNNVDSLIWDFGDGNTLTTIQRIVFHSYSFAGLYVPKVTLKSNSGCVFVVRGTDTIKVDKIAAGFTNSQQHLCGITTVNLSDTSHAFFGINIRRWNFGDGTTATGNPVSHNYTSTGNYNVQLVIIGNSGCSDTSSKTIFVKVNNKPSAAILGDTTGCTQSSIKFTALTQSIDSINFISWTSTNGINSNSNPFFITFVQPGTYTIRLIAGTVNGCFDTSTQRITINPSPNVVASNDVILCRGNSVQLSATGGQQYLWSPFQGLSCSSCSNPIANPISTTSYLVMGTNSFGCSKYDTVLVTVIQPLRITVSGNDSICINQSANLLASGATSYLWSPAAGLSSTTISNPVATPISTIRYRVVGYDGYNCFTDTAFVTVAIGQYPVINLGPDLTLSTGTLFTFNPTIQNGPIQRWIWSPGLNLNCTTCPSPTATIKKDISYWVIATNNYGCSGSDTINIKVFCENSQVFIPNAFSPDGDGINDILMVRGKGIVTVKTFRIFNRWGELIFEKSNFPPNDPTYGWDGKIRGIIGGPDVYIYTAEVVCENGVSFNYKGNTTIIK